MHQKPESAVFNSILKFNVRHHVDINSQSPSLHQLIGCVTVLKSTLMSDVLWFSVCMFLNRLHNWCGRVDICNLVGM